MPMVCPTCQGTFDQRLDCPKCGCRLVYPDKLAPGRPRLFHLGPSWRPSHWLTLVIGLVLAQGIYYGLRHLTIAVALAILGPGPDADEWARGNSGLVLGHLFLAVGLLAGGLIAAAGRKQGALVGAGLGGVNAVLYLIGQQVMQAPLSAWTVAINPMVQAAFGALGGFLGARIWNRQTVLPSTPSLAGIQVPTAGLAPRRRTGLGGQVAWARVFVGMTLAVAGTWWADAIKEAIYTASSSKVAPTTFQDRFLAWELSIVGMFAGAAYAGANTRNGLKQGWMVGLAAGVVLNTIYLVSLGKYPPLPGSGLLDLFGLTIEGVSYPLQTLIFTMFTTVVLGLLGGWFGGELLPPLTARPRGPTWDR